MCRLLPVLALLLVACSRAPTAPPVDPPAPEQPEQPPAINGSLTLHVRDWNLFVSQEFLPSAYVLFGDGSRFMKAIDENGDVHFQDAAIVGPQDVTVVITAKSEVPMVVVRVSTYLAIDQPEAWLPVWASLETTDPPFEPPGPKLATVSGKVTGMSGEEDHSVYVFTAGQGFFGGGPVSPDGSFQFDVLGAEPGQVDLVAREEKFDADQGEVLVRAGRIRGLALARDQELSELEIALDHEADQSLAVTLEGAEHYGSPANVRLVFYEDKVAFFTSYATGTSSLSLPTLAMTPPFDTTRRFLATYLGSELQSPGASWALKHIDNGPAATLTLLSPMAPSAPLLGDCASPPITSSAGFSPRWSIDAAANVGQLDFVLRSSAMYFSWRVMAPSSITSFTPIVFPSEVSPVPSFPPGSYSLKLQSFFRSDVAGYASHFARDAVGNASPAESRTTELKGCFTLQ